MKTSTMLLIGGGAIAAYWIWQQQQAASLVEKMVDAASRPQAAPITGITIADPPFRSAVDYLNTLSGYVHR